MPEPNNNRLDRTIYIPQMADHAFAVGAALRACGFDAEVLPKSDEETLRWAKKHSSGKECFPFIATSGVALPIPLLDEVTVGRLDPMQAQSPDLNLEPYGGGSAGVSRQHARLLHRVDGWYIEDLRSTNGTYLNEVRLLPYRPVRVRSGDLLRFAQMTLVFEEV